MRKLYLNKFLPEKIGKKGLKVLRNINCGAIERKGDCFKCVAEWTKQCGKDFYTFNSGGCIVTRELFLNFPGLFYCLLV